MLKILAKDTGEIGVFRLPDQSLTLYYHSLSSLQKNFFAYCSTVSRKNDTGTRSYSRYTHLTLSRLFTQATSELYYIHSQ